MTQIEQIKAEIERLTEVTGYALSEYENGRRSAMYDIRKQLIEYINILPAEQSSEDLEDEIYNYWRNELTTEDIVTISKDDFIFHATHFAQWQKEKLLNKACKWLNKNVVEYHPRKGELRPIVNINAFREAMED